MDTQLSGLRRLRKTRPKAVLCSLDPEIKLETQWIGEALSRSNLIADRRRPSVRIRDASGAWGQRHMTLAGQDNMMTHCADPREAA